MIYDENSAWMPRSTRNLHQHRARVLLISRVTRWYTDSWKRYKLRPICTRRSQHRKTSKSMRASRYVFCTPYVGRLTVLWLRRHSFHGESSKRMNVERIWYMRVNRSLLEKGHVIRLVVINSLNHVRRVIFTWSLTMKQPLIFNIYRDVSRMNRICNLNKWIYKSNYVSKQKSVLLILIKTSTSRGQ